MPARAPAAYRWIQALLRLAVRAFFRRVEVTGLSNLPRERGGLLVSWHPNGLVDPGLILTQFPRQVVFGARHGLFHYPLLGTLLRRVGTVPIYRAMDARTDDAGARRAANRKSLDALAGEVARGSFSALFPEGDSHDEPNLQELKTGAARLYYRARQLQSDEATPPVIIPVGLHYDSKQIFRSKAFVAFHPPMELPTELDVRPEPDEDDAASRSRAQALTTRVERTLRDVVHATDDWELYHLMHRIRRLVRAERASRAGADPGKTSMGERVLGFARVRAGYYELIEREPERVADLRRRVEEYDADLRALQIEDYDLDRNPKLVSSWLAIILVLQTVGVFLLLPPLVVLGYLVNLPTTLGLIALARFAARKQKDEATVKLLVGLVVFPLTWVAVGVGAGLLHTNLYALFPRLPATPVLAGATVAVLSGLGGVIGLRYWRVARETARAVRVRLTRHRRWYTIARLRHERAGLHDAIVAFADGVELPGEVAPDGRIVPA